MEFDASIGVPSGQSPIEPEVVVVVRMSDGIGELIGIHDGIVLVEIGEKGRVNERALFQKMAFIVEVRRRRNGMEQIRQVIVEVLQLIENV